MKTTIDTAATLTKYLRRQGQLVSAEIPAYAAAFAAAVPATVAPAAAVAAAVAYDQVAGSEADAAAVFARHPWLLDAVVAAENTL